MIVTTCHLICPHCYSTLDLTLTDGGWCAECDLPVLLGRGDGPYLDVWCPHCEHDHHHCRHEPGPWCRFDGMRPDDHRCTCPPGMGDGHRTAHCHTDQSPYWDSGYIAVEYPYDDMTPVCCPDCGTNVMPDTPIGSHDWQRYMVHDRVWRDAGLKLHDGWFCIPCLERRLGRPLTGADLEDVPLNDPDRDDDTDYLKALKRAALEEWVEVNECPDCGWSHTPDMPCMPAERRESF